MGGRIMLKSLKLKTISVVTVGTMLVGLSANACEFHDGPGFSPFAMANPMMKHYSQARAEQNLSLKHKTSIETQVEQPAEIAIRYHAPARYRDVTVVVKGSKSLQLDAKPIKITRTFGVHRVKYNPTKTGTHEIELQVTALNGSEPESFTQKITVVVS